MHSLIILCHRSSVSRPVPVPVKVLVDLSVDILKSNGREEVRYTEGSLPVLLTSLKLSSSFEPSIRSLEVSVIPCILDIGCRLLDCLSLW